MMQDTASASVMVAIAVVLQLLTISFTMATGGMRTQEANLFVFGKKPKSGVYQRACAVLDRIFISGEPVLAVWKRFLKGGEGAPDMLRWFERSDATVTFQHEDVKSFRAQVRCFRACLHFACACSKKSSLAHCLDESCARPAAGCTATHGWHVPSRAFLLR